MSKFCAARVSALLAFFFWVGDAGGGVESLKYEFGYRRRWKNCTTHPCRIPRGFHRSIPKPCDRFGQRCIIGALIFRTGFWGVLYYNYDKVSQSPIQIIKAPTVGFMLGGEQKSM